MHIEGLLLAGGKRDGEALFSPSRERSSDVLNTEEKKSDGLKGGTERLPLR